jgi:hypothetical protein
MDSKNCKKEQTMKRGILAVLATVVAATSGRTCWADVVYDNGDHTASFELASFSSEVADDFTLDTTANITGFQWKGIYKSGSASETDDFIIRIYNAGSATTPTGPPGTSQVMFADVGAISRVDTGATTQGLKIYQYSATIPLFFTATAGMTYWLDIYNNAKGDEWWWSRKTTPVMM